MPTTTIHPYRASARYADGNVMLTAEQWDAFQVERTRILTTLISIANMASTNAIENTHAIRIARCLLLDLGYELR